MKMYYDTKNIPYASGGGRGGVGLGVGGGGWGLGGGGGDLLTKTIS